MNLKKMVIERGMKLMSDPRVMKLMSNPKVMNVVMKGFQLRGKAQASIDQRVQSLAKTLKLATREEVRDLKDTIRTLERALKEVQAEVQKGNGAKAAKPRVVIDPTTLVTDDKLTIATARLRLRPMRRDDAEGLFLVFCDAQAMRFWSSPPHGSPLLTAEVIERAQIAFMAGDGIEWAITRAGDDTAVGKIGHWRWQRTHSRSEVGFILRRDCGGRGSAPRRSAPSSTGVSAGWSCTASRRSSTPRTPARGARSSASASSARVCCASRTSTGASSATRSSTACCPPIDAIRRARRSGSASPRARRGRGRSASGESGAAARAGPAAARPRRAHRRPRRW